MPILHKADKALGCTIAVWHGMLTSEDMTKQLMRLADDPHWSPGPHHLVDGTTLESVVIPDPELVELLYEGTNLVKKTRLAVVVGSDFFDTARPAYETASNTFDVATFTDLESACAYLELSTDEVQRVLDDLRSSLAMLPS